MSEFRLVILDYAKEQLENPIAQKILTDVIFEKQKNFTRTDPNYIVSDKHDMIGTHYLIYETTEFLNPKLVFAIRTTYLERARRHYLSIPLIDLQPSMDQDLKNKFSKFHNQHPNLVDCNAWFVDPDFSHKTTGLNLSDLGYFMVCTNVMREGFNNIIGCTNETYKASRWLENVGHLEKGLFEHPIVKSPHMMILVKEFNKAHFAKVFSQYGDLIRRTYEVFPKNRTPNVTLSEFADNIYNSSVVVKREKNVA